MVKNSKKPRLRFKGFTDEWEQRKVSDLAYRYDNLRLPITAKDRISGRTPYYGANGIQDYVQGFTHEGEFVLIAEDGANDIKNYPVQYVNGQIWVNNHAHVLQANENNITLFIKYLITSSNIASILVGGGRSKLNSDALMNFEISIPIKQEQQKIAKLFLNLDNLITLHQRKYDKLLNVKKALLDKMFPKNQEKTPKIRFKGFFDAWEQRKLGEVAPLRGGYAFKSADYCDEGVPIIRISNILADGTIGTDFVYYKEQQFDNEYLLENGAVLLAMSGATTGKVSILNTQNKAKYYQNQRVGYFPKNKNIDYRYIATILRSQQFINQLTSVLVAGAQPNVSSKDIDNFEFMISREKEEQTKIGNFFYNLDNLIALHQRECEKLKNIKKALLDKMFV